MKKIFVILGLLSIVSTSFATDIETKALLLRGVDKTTGRVKTMQAAVNQPLQFGNLTVLPEKCLTKPQEEMPENAAFLNVFEKDVDQKSKPVFRGWMFSSNPALSAMEHPVYDIWVLKCLEKDVSTPIVSPIKIDKEDDLMLIAEEDNPALAQEEALND